VIWDLDQTAWDGILAEQDADRILFRPEVLQAMKALDERGILQSIASKNDHDNAWHVLERLGLAPLFLHPQISWEPKSSSVRRIAGSLNIAVDGCVLIDDSPFERAEVVHELPGVRVFTDADVKNLLDRPEFDVPVTEESKRRRTFYMEETKRKQHAVEYGNRYEAFLKTCKIEAAIFRPNEREHVERCLELLHRSNQLNLSTHRYTREEFSLLLERPDAVCLCTSCHDRFGDYGIVGIASLCISRERVLLKDFALSCRVAQKKVENAWFKWLCAAVRPSGYDKILASYVRTPRNGVLRDALLEVGFVETTKNEAGSMLELNCETTPPASDIVSIASPTDDVAARIACSPTSRRSVPQEGEGWRHAAS
jgi:FkbH-like protein